MTVRELIVALEKCKNEDSIVVYMGADKGWTNIDIAQQDSDSTVLIIPGKNMEK